MNKNDEKLFKILNICEFPIKKSAVIKMLETGICTEERPFIEYYVAKIVNELIETDEKNIDVLKKHIDPLHIEEKKKELIILELLK